MLRIKVDGVVEEILYMGEKSCKFIISDDKEGSPKDSTDKGLVCTITKGNIKLADKLVAGEKFNFIGEIKAYKKKTEKGLLIQNVFYINEIEKNKKGESNLDKNQ